MIKGEKKDNRGRSPGSLAALKATQCKKGEHPPGAGRPKGSLSLKDRIHKYLDVDVKIKMPDGSIQDKSILEGIILSLLNQAQKGNIKAIQEVFDRGFGKEAEVVHIKHEDALKELE
jgi:hypothetical protein